MVVLKKNLKVCWLSAGVSSFIAGYLERESIDEFIYIDIKDQHEDSMRFMKDCEKVLCKKITILQSEYENVDTACKVGGFINRPKVGAYCTKYLKKRVRKEWEDSHKNYEITYVWGFDFSEKHRAESLNESMPQFNHEYPLIDRMLTKQDVHAIFDRLFDFKRPYMYDLGYSNNNCIGCIKGGMGYWNKIRIDFPEIFKKRCELERTLGCSCINGIYLDELDPNRGRMEDEIMQDCGVMCYLNLN